MKNTTKIIRVSILWLSVISTVYLMFFSGHTFVHWLSAMIMMTITAIMVTVLVEEPGNTLTSSQIHSIQPISPVKEWLSNNMTIGGTWQYRLLKDDELVMDSKWHMEESGFKSERSALIIGKINANYVPQYNLRVEVYDASKECKKNGQGEYDAITYKQK